MYIVQHVPSGKYLPPRKSRTSSMTRKALSTVPRIFNRRTDALRALNWWVKGVVVMSREGDMDSVPIVNRRRSDFCLIPITLRKGPAEPLKEKQSAPQA